MVVSGMRKVSLRSFTRFVKIRLMTYLLGFECIVPLLRQIQSAGDWLGHSRNALRIVTIKGVRFLKIFYTCLYFNLFRLE